CGPQPKAQPPPPMAHEPKPTVVIWNPLEPSGRVGKLMMAPPNRECRKERWHALNDKQFNRDCVNVPVKRIAKAATAIFSFARRRSAPNMAPGNPRICYRHGVCVSINFRQSRSRIGEKMPNRRDFIKSVVGASAGVVFVGCDICDAMAAGRSAQAGSRAKHKPAMVGKRRVKTVDVHCHVSVPEATELLKGTKIERRLGAGIALGGCDESE